MPNLSWRVDRCDGVTLVAATIRTDVSAGTATSVTIASRLDGPVWPPRSNGVPLPGWDGTEYEAVVPADGAVGVGFASPAEPTEPPVEVVDCGSDAAADDAAERSPDPVAGAGDVDPVASAGDVDAVAGGADPTAGAEDVDAADVLRALGDPSPPRDAVPSRSESADRSPAGSRSPGDVAARAGRSTAGDDRER